MGATLSKNLVDILQQTTNSSITNVYNSNSSETSIEQLLENGINIIIKGHAKCTELVVDQYIDSSLDTISTIDRSDSTKIANELKGLLDTNIDQIMKGVYESLGSIGEVHKQDNETHIKQVLTNFIQQTVNKSFVDKIIQKIHAGNKLNIEISPDADLDANKCTFKQGIVVKQAANNTVKNLVDAAFKNTEVNEAFARVKQENDMQTKGLISLVGQFTIIIIAIVIGATVFFAFGGSTAVKAITNPFFLIVVAVIVAGFFAGAYFLKIGPFKKPQFWGCKKLEGTKMNDPKQGCIEYQNAQDGPFPSKAACEEKINLSCPIYYGCTSVGKGTEAGTCGQVEDGPFGQLSKCQEYVADKKICYDCFVCRQKPSGSTFIKECVATKNPYDDQPYQDQETCKVSCKT